MLLCILVASVYLAVSLGAGSETLRQEAERALAAMAGHPMDVRLGGSGITLAGGALLSLRVEDARLADARDGRLLAEAGSIGFGIRGLPLLTGSVQLGSARISDARIALPDMPSGEGGFWRTVSDERGLLEPERLGRELFSALHSVLDGLDAGMTERLELVNVVVALPDGGQVGDLIIDRARLQRGAGGKMDFDAALTIAGRSLDIRGTASRPEPGAPIKDFAIRLEAGEAAQEGTGFLDDQLGSARFELGGSEGPHGFERLDLRAELDGAVFAQGRSTEAAFDVVLSAHTEAGFDKVEISDLVVTRDRSRWRFHGAIGPNPDMNGDISYRYELVSDGSRVAPEDSLETPIDVVARVAGRVEADWNRLTMDEIAVRTANGEVHGRAALTLVPGKPTGIELEIAVADFTVSDSKQLWPWFAAPEARKWVHENLFGGRVIEGRIALAVAPGRFGDGVPLTPNELAGRFEVERVRFDVAGRLPPVREGVGSVDFEGSIVDIRLETGSVFLPSGKSVSASNGRFLIDVSRADDDSEDREPLIGELDIDVAGEASAILELAGYEPISVQRHLDFGPEDFSGQVQGKIVADIPLQAGIERDDLDWMVMLDFSELSLARPFNGHEISEAFGSILVEPDRVVIDARARLDGMPAEVSLVEPLGDREGGRSQAISLDLGDADRDRLMPGLANILSGRAAVTLRGDGASAREIGANLATATLTLPWAGWSKGPGIPAKASFVMETDGTHTVLERFAVGGDTFSVNGRITLDDGHLASAHFERMRLNRDDDFSVRIDRAGRGYRLDISGRAIDVRPLIKQFTNDSESGSDVVEGVPITISASIDEARGFHDEVLRQVKLEFRSVGALIEQLDFSATTRSGQPVRFRKSTAQGTRQIAMQSTDAGAIVRFLDLYERMESGTIELALSGAAGEALHGHVNVRDFWLVNEPRLGSIVSSRPEGGDRSLNQALRSQIDVSRVHIERGFAEIGKGSGYLRVRQGVLRGPAIGTTFRGLVYDADGNMELSGTFIPAYGLNRIFGEIPVLGRILGNGPDGGLIGITYRLAGTAGEPQLQINPLSAVAPGIFRSVFEFN